MMSSDLPDAGTGHHVLKKGEKAHEKGETHCLDRS